MPMRSRAYSYYLGGFEGEVAGGKAVNAAPDALIWLPACANLELSLGTGEELALPFWERQTERLIRFGWDRPDGKDDDGNIINRYHADNVFCEDNLISRDEQGYVFRTRYSPDLSGLLPRSALAERQLTGDRRAYFLDSIPDTVRELADIIVRKNGSGEDLASILSGIHTFITYGERPIGWHAAIPLETLVEEYKRTLSFSGDCKERLVFAKALCNALDIPCRGVSGKSYYPGGHVWAEAYAPTPDGHIWVPLCSLTEFNTLHPAVHLLWGNVPDLVPEKESFWKSLFGSKKALPPPQMTLSARRV